MKKILLLLLLCALVFLGAKCSKTLKPESFEEQSRAYYTKVCDRLMEAKKRVAELPEDSMLRLTVQVYQDKNDCVERNIRNEKSIYDICVKDEEEAKCQEALIELRETIEQALFNELGG